MDSRFALRNFAGRATAFFRVTTEEVASDAVTTKKQPAHHIAIVDRSGSMYYDLGNLKEMLEKIMTLDEYRDEDLRYTLISYSSSGDCTLHFAHVPVSDVMNTNNPYLQAIRSIRVTGLTGISQSLEMAKGAVHADEATCISLHSDGYANDPSPSYEARQINALVAELAQNPNLFINTVAYRSWCDFKLLSAMANAASGVCIQAQNVKQVYDALYSTSTMLVGNLSPSIEMEIKDACYQVFASRSAGKVVGSVGDITVRGLGSEDDKTLFRFWPMTESDFNSSPLGECGVAEDLDPVWAYAKAQLAEGNINKAKYALVSTKAENLLERHAKALVTEEIASFASDLDSACEGSITLVTSSGYGLDTTQASVLEIVAAMNEHRSDIRVNIDDLMAVYKRRGVKRIRGVRQEDGTVEEPSLKTEYTDTPPWLRLSGLDINRNNATINMRLTRSIKLVKVSDGSDVTEVAGIPLAGKLFDYKNYTLVGDGSLNVPHITVRISTKSAFGAFKDMGVLSGDFDPEKVYQIKLDGRPLVDYEAVFKAPDKDTFDRLLRMKSLSAVLAAILKEDSAAYTSEQVAELKANYLSANLYVNFPSTTEYADLQVALAAGEVDTRISYKVDIGTPEILTAGKVMSGNKVLDRLFTVTKAGEVKGEKKPKWTLWWDDVAFGFKTLSARTKLNAVDDLMKPIVAEFLGLETNGKVDEILTMAGLDDTLKADFSGAMTRSTGRDDAVDAFSKVRKALDAAAEALYQEKVIPVSFYIGATGLVPDNFGAKALSAEELTALHTGLKLTKAEKDAMFFPVGDMIITVYLKAENFSTSKRAVA